MHGINIFDWYWAIGVDRRLWSSAACDYVEADNAAYLTWLANNPQGAMAMPSEQALVGFLSSMAPTIVPTFPAGLIAYTKFLRYRRELSSITVGGVEVDTDDRSKLMIAGARIKADADPAFTTMWQGVTPLTATQIIAISDAVLDHVDQCFALQGVVLAEIAAGTITTRAQVDAAFAAV
jgi:hypothetical protein